MAAVRWCFSEPATLPHIMTPWGQWNVVLATEGLDSLLESKWYFRAIPNTTTVLIQWGWLCGYCLRMWREKIKKHEVWKIEETKLKKIKRATERVSRCRAGRIKLSNLGLIISVIYESVCVSLFISVSPHYKWHFVLWKHNVKIHW